MKFTAVLLMVIGLAGCQTGADKTVEGPVVREGAEKVVAAPDRAPPKRPAPVAAAPAAVAAAASTEPAEVVPAVTPEATAAPEEAVAEAPEVQTEVVPPPVVLPEQRACERRGGRFGSPPGSTFTICFITPRDAGKSCRKASDCSGDCLARSRSCSPIVPLFGCNEVLNGNGARETQCIN